ncbi:unnamed protein product [Musa hybrid cultivar]
MEIPNAHSQAMARHHVDELLVCPKNQPQQERRPRPHPEQALKCPRCASTNTKFCYYNNYSLSQPRYFCKGCRRYWTQGGSLRNVPVGGGCRKNKRSSSSFPSKRTQDLDLTATSSINPLPPTFVPPPLASDLTLAFSGLHKEPPTEHLGLENHCQSLLLEHASTESILTTLSTNNGFLDTLRSGSVDALNPSGLNNPYYGFGVHGSVEVKVGVSVEDRLMFPVGGPGDAAARTVTGQGSWKDMDEGEAKVLMGLPWQVEGDGNMAVDSGRDWTGGASSWPGLMGSSMISAARTDMSSTIGDAYAFF